MSQTDQRAETDAALALVTAQGRPMRAAQTDRCPRCGAGTEKREASSGFGIAYPVCGRCGYEWVDEVWRG